MMLSVVLGFGLICLGGLCLLVVLVGRSDVKVKDPNLDGVKENLELLSPDELRQVKEQVTGYVNRKSI